MIRDKQKRTFHPEFGSYEYIKILMVNKHKSIIAQQNNDTVETLAK